MAGLRSFEDEPSDKYVRGDVNFQPRFLFSTNVESQENVKPRTTYESQWVMPKSVQRIPGKTLVTYDAARERFRRLAKVSVLSRLNLIPSPQHSNGELQSFRGRPLGFGTLGQTSPPNISTGDWGNLVSSLVAGVSGAASTYFSTQGQMSQAQAIAAAQPPPSPILSSGLMPIIIIGGIAYLFFRKRGRR